MSAPHRLPIPGLAGARNLDGAVGLAAEPVDRADRHDYGPTVLTVRARGRGRDVVAFGVQGPHVSDTAEQLRLECL